MVKRLIEWLYVNFVLIPLAKDGNVVKIEIDVEDEDEYMFEVEFENDCDQLDQFHHEESTKH